MPVLIVLGLLAALVMVNAGGRTSQGLPTGFNFEGGAVMPDFRRASMFMIPANFEAVFVNESPAPVQISKITGEVLYKGRPVGNFESMLPVTVQPGKKMITELSAQINTPEVVAMGVSLADILSGKVTAFAARGVITTPAAAVNFQIEA